ncbi:MAG: T9SS type A sorting domain-containing protein, partial [Saprospiraceae bacterium]|nr:T9SS type A sorting domain-containing protein [Saprospiraceae bacterium]
SINIEETSCDENADGEVNILVNGATPPVQFLWNTGDTTQNLIGIPSGGYEVTVTDAQNCMAIAGGMVMINDQIDPRPIIRDEFWTIYLNEQGIAELSPTQVDSSSFDNCSILDMQLSQGVFDCSNIGKQYIEFTVIDHNLNLASREIEVTVLDTLLPFYNCTPDITVAACDGIVEYTRPQIVDNCPNGSVTAVNGLGSGSVFPLGTTTETYTYTDGDGNQAVCSFDVTVEKRISATVNVSDVKCPGQSNGAATVTIDNGEGNYNFQWSDGQSTQSAVNLSPGNYSVTITDTTECTFVRSVFVGEPVGIFVRLDSIKAPDGKGDLYISVFGGTPPYQFEWDNGMGIVSMTEDPKNLEFGDYNLRLTDANGCQFNTFSAKVDMTTPLREVSNIRHVKINPNPTSGRFKLDFPNMTGSQATIEVYNLSGRRIFEIRRTIQPEMEVDVSMLHQGIYLVKVTVDGDYVTKRLIIR